MVSDQSIYVICIYENHGNVKGGIVFNDGDENKFRRGDVLFSMWSYCVIRVGGEGGFLLLLPTYVTIAKLCEG